MNKCKARNVHVQFTFFAIYHKVVQNILQKKTVLWKNDNHWRWWKCCDAIVETGRTGTQSSAVPRWPHQAPINVLSLLVVCSQSCHMDYTHGQNSSSFRRDQMNVANVNKCNFSTYFCVFVWADLVVLLSNPWKGSFSTDPRSSAADSISSVSEPEKNYLWHLEVTPDFSAISVSASNLGVWQASADASCRADVSPTRQTNSAGVYQTFSDKALEHFQLF